MTTDLKIYKGRLKSTITSITPKGYEWLIKTFEKPHLKTIDNEDISDVIKQAKEAGMEVDD